MDGAIESFAQQGGAWTPWARGLPGTLTSVLGDWDLLPDGDARRGETALVMPVVTAEGAAAMLKLAGPPPELDHEHLALIAWAGNGAVRLLRADPHRRALLLERLEPRDLSQEWDVAACEVIGGLLSRLRRGPLPQLRPLSGYLRKWREDLAGYAGSPLLPRRLVTAGLGILDDLIAEDDRSAMLHGDLHYGNVLAASREPWLAIDPQPMSGDPHYEAAPAIINRAEDVAGYVRSGLRSRLSALSEAAGLDPDRARIWTIARAMLDAAWRLQDAGPSGPDEADRAYVTWRLTVVKAMGE